MTEASTTTTEERCQWGAHTDRPCRRPVTDSGSGTWVCEEHARLRDHGDEADAWLFALEATRTFVRSGAVQKDWGGAFRDLAYNFLEAVTNRAAEAAITARVAEVLANQGPDEQGPEEEMRRIIGANMLIRSDYMTSALAILDGELEPDESERLIAYASVRYAAKFVRKELEDFRKQQGLGKAGPREEDA